MMPPIPREWRTADYTHIKEETTNVFFRRVAKNTTVSESAMLMRWNIKQLERESKSDSLSSQDGTNPADAGQCQIRSELLQVSEALAPRLFAARPLRWQIKSNSEISVSHLSHPGDDFRFADTLGIWISAFYQALTIFTGKFAR